MRYAPRSAVRLAIWSLVLLVLALTGPGGVTATAAEKAIWGPLTLPGGASAFPTYRDLGVDTLQMRLDWATTAPMRPRDPANTADPAYHWPAGIDRALSERGATGIQVALLVTRSPGWANGGESPIHAPNAADFATFVAAASRRYPAVRRWMIWGEPNRSDRFLPNAEGSPVGPRAYAPILDAAYVALKGVSRSNIVIGGMTWTGGTVKPAPFLRLMRLPNGRPPRLDWFGHNPFPFRFPNLKELNIMGGWRDISDLDVFGDELRRVYGPSVRFWLSEYTVLSDHRSENFELSVSRPEQARWLKASYAIADSLPSVAGLGWISLTDEREEAGSSNWGLLTASGAHKPAYDAYRLAPSVRFRPRIRAAKRISRSNFSRRGLRVQVRPQVGGRISVELGTRHGRRVARTSRRARAGQLRALRLKGRRVRWGRYVLTVRAPRSETVRRWLRVR